MFFEVQYTNSVVRNALMNPRQKIFR